VQKNITMFKNFTRYVARRGSKGAVTLPNFPKIELLDKTAPYLVIRYLKRTDTILLLETVYQSDLGLKWDASRHAPAFLSYFTSRRWSFSKLGRALDARQPVILLGKFPQHFLHISTMYWTQILCISQTKSINKYLTLIRHTLIFRYQTSLLSW